MFSIGTGLQRTTSSKRMFTSTTRSNSIASGANSALRSVCLPPMEVNRSCLCGGEGRIWFFLFPAGPVIRPEPRSPQNGRSNFIFTEYPPNIFAEHSGQLHIFSNLHINICGLHYDLLGLVLARHCLPYMACQMGTTCLARLFNPFGGQGAPPLSLFLKITYSP